MDGYPPPSPGAQYRPGPPARVAVIGSGIAGLACAWSLARRHDVTLFEAADTPGGHCCTIDVPLPGGASQPVDMGFIVYNERTYPNLTAFFAHLGVATEASTMSLGLSLDDGAFEYGGDGIGAVLAQPRNLLRPRLWRMFADLARLYREAPAALADETISLGAWLDARGYGAGFQRDHLLPMAAAIWSCPPGAVRAQPAASFFRFCANHGLLQWRDRPRWRTLSGGSRSYVQKVLANFAGRLRLACKITAVTREGGQVALTLGDGGVEAFDHVVLATHGDQASRLLRGQDARESDVLGRFRTVPNRVVMHQDARLMPQARRAWSAWNFISPRGADGDALPCVTYWMNRLQNFQAPGDVFVTVNPRVTPAPGSILAERQFNHPVFDTAALAAQRAIWGIQGAGGVWYAGAYLGAGFHEDGIQAGLHVAEALGAPPRPWQGSGLSARLYLPDGRVEAA